MLTNSDLPTFQIDGKPLAGWGYDRILEKTTPPKKVVRALFGAEFRRSGRKTELDLRFGRKSFWDGDLGGIEIAEGCYGERSPLPELALEIFPQVLGRLTLLLSPDNTTITHRAEAQQQW